MRKKCIIIGNGPSLKDVNINELDGEIVCCNWFLNHEKFERLKISWYCAYDNAFIYPTINMEWKKKLGQIQGAKAFPIDWKIHINDIYNKVTSASPINNSIKLMNSDSA